MTASALERTATALSSLGVPYGAGRYLPASGNVLPDLFLAYTLVTEMPAQVADDDEIIRFSRVQISIFNRAGLTSLPNVTGAMKTAGFKYSRTTLLPFDQQTRHFGLALEFVSYQEK
jgi:hypothetical protein